jgi:hypothetical protein
MTNWEQFFSGSNTQDRANIVGTGLDIYGDYMKLKEDRGRQREAISPLEESYKNLMEMSKSYADPNSQMNQQARNEIRQQNMEGFADIANRQRMLSTGEYSGSSTQPVQQSMMSDAISQALKNYSAGRANRMQLSGDYAYKAAAAGRHLASARQDQYAADKTRQSQIGDLAQEYGSNIMDWFKPA